MGLDLDRGRVGRYGLVFRWFGGFGAAGKAIEGWGDHSARRWARRRGVMGF